MKLGKNCQICVPASVTAIGLIGGPRARHAVFSRGILNSDDLFSVPLRRIPTPHELKENNSSGLLASCICSYHTVQCCTQQWVDDMGACLWRRLRCTGNVFPGIFASGIWKEEFWRMRNFGLGRLCFWIPSSSDADYWPRLWHHPIRSIIVFRLLRWRGGDEKRT